MPKYSTGGSSRSGAASACELCGTSTDSLQEATIAGATLSVCRSCAPHDDRQKRSGSEQDAAGSAGGESRKRRAARNAAQLADGLRGDPSHWEEHGTNYDDDPLPYLVSGYGDLVREAREAADLVPAALADELDVDEADLLAVEEGRAARAGIGGGLIAALEEYLDVTIAERA